jgi:hypothetical protein
MPEQPRLDVLELQRTPEQRIVVEVDLPDRQIIDGAPIRVHFLEQRRLERGAM